MLDLIRSGLGSLVLGPASLTLQNSNISVRSDIFIIFLFAIRPVNLNGIHLFLIT